MEQATKQQTAPAPEIAQGIGYFEQTMEILRQEGKTPKIFSKIADIMEGVKAVDKNNKNKDQNYKFRSIYDVYNEIQPLFADSRVFTSNIVLKSNEEKIKFSSGSVATRVVMRVAVWFITDDGSAMPTIVEVEGMDFGDKAYNKALSFAHKYAIMQMFSIPTKELAEGDEESLETKDGGRVGPTSMNGQQNGQQEKEQDPDKVKLNKKNQNKVKKKVQNLPENHRFRDVKVEELTINQGKKILAFVNHYVGIVQQANKLLDNKDIDQKNHKALIGKAMQAEKIAELKDLANKMATITDGKKQAEAAYSMDDPADRETLRDIREGLKHLPEDRRKVIDKELQSGDITFGEADEYLTEIEECKKESAE